MWLEDGHVIAIDEPKVSFRMSEAVFIYQISILSSIVAAGLIVAPNLAVLVAVAWVVWTLVMVFSGWLFILQFGTIAAAVLVSTAIHSSQHFPAIRKFIRRALLWIILLAIVGICTGIYFESKARERAPNGGIPREKVEEIVSPRHPQFDALGAKPGNAQSDRALDRKQELEQRRLTRSPAFDVATDEILHESPLPAPVVPLHIYSCYEERAGETHFTAQDFPCGESRRRWQPTNTMVVR